MYTIEKNSKIDITSSSYYTLVPEGLISNCNIRPQWTTVYKFTSYIYSIKYLYNFL